MTEEGKIKNFTDLRAWREGHKLVLKIYKITEDFPDREIYGLVSQMRRCVVSITSNIAEGFRRTTDKDKNNFYNIALGSLTELQNQLVVARDVGYLEKEEFNYVAYLTVNINKMIFGLKKFNFNK